MVNRLCSEDREQLQSLEEDLWREKTRFDLVQMEQIFAEDFLELGRSGRVYRRSDSLSIPRQPINARIPLPDFEVRSLAENVVQITYNSEVTYQGVVEKARRSSIWTRSTGRWILKFHQGTPFSDSVRNQS